MPSGIETQALGVDPSVDPVILAVMFVAFLIGAVGPFALCVVGSIREERAMRRLAAAPRTDRPAPPTVANAADRAVASPAPAVQAVAATLPRVAANDAVESSRVVGG